MPAATCIAEPPFGVVADPVNKQVAFLFDNEQDRNLIKSYEWYINGLPVIDLRTDTLNVQLTPGHFIIGRRILTEDGWSGLKECDVNVWANIEYYADFFKNDLGANYSGTRVPYSVFALPRKWAKICLISSHQLQ